MRESRLLAGFPRSTATDGVAGTERRGRAAGGREGWVEGLWHVWSVIRWPGVRMTATEPAWPSRAADRPLGATLARGAWRRTLPCGF